MRILTISAVLVLAGSALAAGDPPQILGIRHHSHGDYDRLVFEIDGPIDVFHQPVRNGEEFVLEMGARPSEPAQTIDTGLARIGRVRVEAIGDGAIVRVEALPRRVRAFVLNDPTRVVVDFASPDPAAFPVPSGTTAVVAAEAPPFDTKSVDAAPALLPRVDDPHSPPSTASTLVRSFSGMRVALGVLVLSIVGLAGIFLLRSSSSAEPKLAGAGAPVGGGGDPVEVAKSSVREPAAKRPFPTVPTPTPTVTQSTPVEPKAEPLKAVAALPPKPAPATIKPSEVGSPSDGSALLERRLDDEVRARMRLEERLEKTQEELKVLRDRLHRLSRREGRERD